MFEVVLLFKGDEVRTTLPALPSKGDRLIVENLSADETYALTHVHGLKRSDRIAWFKVKYRIICSDPTSTEISFKCKLLTDK